jgi:hypothetical protein
MQTETNGAASPAPVAPLFPGVSITSGTTNKAPILLVIGDEKSGKSTTVTTSLFGYPTPNHQPLVLAWDPTGPVSCIKLGFHPHAIDINAQPGATRWAKAQGVMSSLESNITTLKERYGSLVIDCTSVMVDRLHEDARRYSKNPDPRSHFGECLLQGKEFINRVVDLGLPTVWLAWARASETVESVQPNGQKARKLIMGGPNILGNTRAFIAGKAHQIFIIEKQKRGQVEGADANGYVRIVHSQPWENINAGGRYEHILPEPCPPHFGWILSQITGTGQWAPQAAAT